MNRKLRSAKSPQQIKDEQVNFLLENIEKHLEEHRKIVETKDKQLVEIKKILQGAKNSYQSLAKENKQVKQYIIKIRQQQQQQPQKEQEQQRYFRPKKYKKVVYEEATVSEPEIEEEAVSTEEIIE